MGKRLFMQTYDYSHLIGNGMIRGLMVPEKANEDGYRFEIELSAVPSKVKQDDLSSVAWNAINAPRDSNIIQGTSGADIKHALGFYADVQNQNDARLVAQQDTQRAGTEVSSNKRANRLAHTTRT